jgi:uncharacterized protein (UPF0332 family)
MAKKTLYSIDKLLEEGLLRKIPVSKEKAEESLRTAESWIDEAKNNLHSNAFRSCIISSYLAMFHSARGVMFGDGFREKSHFAVARYLENKYVRKNLLEQKSVELLDHYRETRHDDQYSTSFFATEDDAGKAINSAIAFVTRIRNLVKHLSLLN